MKIVYGFSYKGKMSSWKVKGVGGVFNAMYDNLINKRMRRNCGEMSSTRWNRVKPLVHVFQRNTLTEGKTTSSICEFFHIHLWVFTLFVGLLFLPFYGIASFFAGLSRDPFWGLFPLYHILSHTDLIQGFFFFFHCWALAYSLWSFNLFCKSVFVEPWSFGFHKAHDLVP